MFRAKLILQLDQKILTMKYNHKINNNKHNKIKKKIVIYQNRILMEDLMK